MSRSVFDALDRTWTRVARSPDAATALERWRPHPALAAPDLDTLIAGVWAASKADADRVLAALATRAPSDLVAARTLLQILRPGLRSLGRRLALGGSFDDVDQELLALAWEQIRTYRIDRRPTAVAANILLDIRKRFVRAVLAPAASPISLEDVVEARRPAMPSAEHEALDAEGPSLRRAHARLVAAVDQGAITPLSASVVWRTRVQQGRRRRGGRRSRRQRADPPAPPPARRTTARRRQLSQRAHVREAGRPAATRHPMRLRS